MKKPRRKFEVGSNQFWGIVLLIGGLVSVVVAPPSAIAVLALAFIAIFAGGYLSMVHLQDKDKDKDGKD